MRKTGEKPMRTPALVATALPPLKLAKIGKVWPRTARRPKIIGEIPVTPKIVGNKTAKVPLRKSIANTIIPAFFPKIRKVLVVPVFPEPCSRRLMLKKIFPIHKPEGIEPNKYANTSKRIVFIIVSLYQKCFEWKRKFLAEVSHRIVDLIQSHVNSLVKGREERKILQNFLKSCNIEKMNKQEVPCV